MNYRTHCLGVPDMKNDSPLVIQQKVRDDFIKQVVDHYKEFGDDPVSLKEVDSALTDYLKAWFVMHDLPAVEPQLFTGDSIDRELCRYIIDEKRYAGTITIDKEMKTHLWRKVGDPRYDVENLDR